METLFLELFLKKCMIIMQENQERLIEMDSVVGDGDLGLTMSDGFEAAYNAVKEIEGSDLGQKLYYAGKAMANKVPSTMGTLMASGFMKAGKTLKGKKEEIIMTGEFLEAYANGVMERGKAKLGEKTFIDGFLPGKITYQNLIQAGKTYFEAAKEAEEQAIKGFYKTSDMQAKHGRAAIHGDNSRTFPDPGAYVAVLMFNALSETFEEISKNNNG